MSMKKWLFSKNLQQEHTLVHEINSSQEEEHIFLHIKLHSTDYCMSWFLIPDLWTLDVQLTWGSHIKCQLTIEW